MRWSLLGLLGVFLGCLSGPVMAAGVCPPARDFVADGAGRAPILVFFTNASCPYCREVENLYLRPMHARGDYRGQLLIRWSRSAAPRR